VLLQLRLADLCVVPLRQLERMRVVLRRRLRVHPLSFGPARGVGFSTFCKFVKRLTAVQQITGKRRQVRELPSGLFQRPNLANLPGSPAFL
jgi:hypothetical protein